MVFSTALHNTRIQTLSLIIALSLTVTLTLTVTVTLILTLSPTCPSNGSDMQARVGPIHVGLGLPRVRHQSQATG